MRNRFWKAIVVAAIGTMISCSSGKNINGMEAQFDKQGHRGSRGLMPENTIPAMKKAIDLGVTTLEMDLVISRDHKVVVSHDVYFHQNITTTPEGKTLTATEAQSRWLYAMDYDSIRKYDVGMKPHPDYPRQEKVQVYKPLLSDLLDATEQYGKQKGRSLAYNIEIKSNPANDGKKHPPVEIFVDLAMEVIQAKGIASRTTIQSFDPRALQVMQRKYPAITTSLLIEDDDKRTVEKQWEELGFVPKIYSPHHSLVTKELVEKCHSRNVKLVPWTVNKLEDMRRLKALGVDGIITDYPDLFLEL